jgi:hypothetical protein
MAKEDRARMICVGLLSGMTWTTKSERSSILNQEDPSNSGISEEVPAAVIKPPLRQIRPAKESANEANKSMIDPPAEKSEV